MKGAQPSANCGFAAWLGLAVALLLCLSVLLLNAAPLYYHDSIGYLQQGGAILSSLAPDASANGSAVVSTAQADTQVSGNRSATYALLFAALWHLVAPWAPVIVNFLAVVLAAFLAGRVAARISDDKYCPIILISLPLIGGALTSLPFYVSYMMPDVFTGLALLMVALLVAAVHDMRPWEIALAALLIVAGAISHRSTLVILVLMIPLAALVSVFVSKQRWWLAPAVIALASVVGFVELKGYERAADKVFEKDTVYSPFLTARLIADGPGLRYLETHCPDAAIATCKLYEALGGSDDPWRLTATHILFDGSQRLGSYKLLSAEDQQSVALDQRDFVKNVFLDQPAQVISAVVLNTLRQARQNSIVMTVPSPPVQDRIVELSGGRVAEFGRLAQNQAWIPGIETFHLAIYLAALAAIVVALAVPGAIQGRGKALVLMVLLGILVNAFVCGAVSQPADRYGARVSWLLPYVAMMVTVFSVKTLTSRRANPAMFKGN